jgi:D-alanyl-D-alanine carboxypeptidase
MEEVGEDDVGMAQVRMAKVATGLNVRRLILMSLLAAPMAAAAVHGAAARPDRRATHHHYYIAPPAAAQAPPSAGFGPTSNAPSAILIDAASGRVIAESGADIPRYPASLTKLMVLDLTFVALDEHRMTLDTQIPVSNHAAAAAPVKLGLAPGSSLSARDAIMSMTTMSANDAATALGEFLGGGSEDRVAAAMTLRAHALGMAQTQFYNASGLPNPNQVSTARDLAILARDIVVNFPQYQNFFEIQQFQLGSRTIYSNNQMLKTFDGATGMKTGYTILARHNLVISAVRDGHALIGVDLHEPSWGAAYAQETAMLDDGFAGAPVAFNAPPAGPAWQPAAPRRAPVGMLARADAHAWGATLGPFARRVTASQAAASVHRVAGPARIASFAAHGHRIWTAELSGLTQAAAYRTCNTAAAHGAGCRIMSPDRMIADRS